MNMNTHARMGRFYKARVLAFPGSHWSHLLPRSFNSALRHTPPRMAQMITFRLNTKPTYSERMTDARSAITNDRNATMAWSRKSYMKNIVTRYRVRIEGWPLAEVPFRNLSDVSNLPKLELLLRGWKEGTIRFCRIHDAQYQQMLTDPTPWIGPPSAEGEGDGDAD
ncbi:hypothetical protein GSI_03681 [Ganoderma sinense ZZ0214-1]|uniref:Uncharacterized protein n=1 Tax=Ganoderma sinense ZZ0214-1 TaxID=1077348 RepID=A0A2G8SJN1_9APHY|nr:hypothetical protein GSI_03681 [Ganoderma sinense ZZ0214-1]